MLVHLTPEGARGAALRARRRGAEAQEWFFGARFSKDPQECTDQLAGNPYLKRALKWSRCPVEELATRCHFCKLVPWDPLSRRFGSQDHAVPRSPHAAWQGLLPR